MAHEIAELANGQNAIAYFGAVPWMGLGFCGDAQTSCRDVDAWLARCGADAIHAIVVECWARYTPEMSARLGRGGIGLPSDVARAIVNEQDGRVLGACGGVYEPVQFTELADALRPLVEDGRLDLSCMALLRGGRTFFACCRIASVDIGGGDRVDHYLVATGSHDGTSAVKFFRTAVRVVCANTLAMGLGGAFETVTIRHTATASDRVAAFARALDESGESIGATLQAWQRMARTPVNGEQVSTFVADLLPLPEKPEQHARAVANVAKGRAIMLDLFETGDGADLASARGTVWGLYHAATAYASHVQRAKQDAESRLFRMTEGSGATFIARAEGLALAMVA